VKTSWAQPIGRCRTAQTAYVSSRSDRGTPGDQVQLDYYEDDHPKLAGKPDAPSDPCLPPGFRLTSFFASLNGERPTAAVCLFDVNVTLRLELCSRNKAARAKLDGGRTTLTQLRPDETVVVSHPYDQSRLDDSRLRTDVLVQVEKVLRIIFRFELLKASMVNPHRSLHGESHDPINPAGAAPGPEGYIDWREYSPIPRWPARLLAQHRPRLWPSRELPHWTKACVPGERA
jgi:hypothetical protein